MSTPTIAYIYEGVPGSVKTGAIDHSADLDSGETITGTPTAAVSQLSGTTDADGVSVGSVAANAAAETINGTSVAIGKATLFTVTIASDAARGSRYQILVTAVTTEGQTIKERVDVVVI